MERIKERALEGKKGIIPHSLETFSPYIAKDCKKDPYYVSFREERVLSQLAYPFEVDKEQVGIILINSQFKDYYRDFHLEIIKNLLKNLSFEIRYLNFYGSFKEKKDFLWIGKFFKDMDEFAKKIAQSDDPVLFYGETGSGKEIFSRYIHFLSKRKDRPFIPINCSSFPEELISSELFGHRKGSFTGALKDKVGQIQIADGGTVLLDEVQDSTLRFQHSLLRVIENGEIQPIGSEEKPLIVDVRIIASSSEDLEKLIKEKKFSDSLYYRIKAFKFYITPLRERDNEEKRGFIIYFIKKAEKEFKKEFKEITSEAMDILLNYHFPGNIRELRGIMRNALLFSEDGIIREKDIVNQISIPKSIIQLIPEELSLNERIKIYEREEIIKSLKETNWNVSKAAEKLQISRQDLQYKIKKYKITS
ncbi:MAG: sigma 54-interacting transcriptional regulator [Acidobacteriota bacterium]